MTVSRSCINIWGKYTLYHFSSHLNCIMISMQTQVNRGQGTKLSGSWKQLQRFLSLTMLGWFKLSKAACTCIIKNIVSVFKMVLKCC